MYLSRLDPNGISHADIKPSFGAIGSVVDNLDYRFDDFLD
jgi:hypothetical protein